MEEEAEATEEAEGRVAESRGAKGKVQRARTSSSFTLFTPGW